MSSLLKPLVRLSFALIWARRLQVERNAREELVSRSAALQQGRLVRCTRRRIQKQRTPRVILTHCTSSHIAILESTVSHGEAISPVSCVDARAVGSEIWLRGVDFFGRMTRAELLVTTSPDETLLPASSSCRRPCWSLAAHTAAHTAARSEAGENKKRKEQWHHLLLSFSTFPLAQGKVSTEQVPPFVPFLLSRLGFRPVYWDLLQLRIHHEVT